MTVRVAQVLLLILTQALLNGQGNGIIPSGWTQTVSQNSVTLAPGAFTSVTMSITSPASQV